jgi:hypothetical protein
MGSAETKKRCLKFKVILDWQRGYASFLFCLFHGKKVAKEPPRKCQFSASPRGLVPPTRHSHGSLLFGSQRTTTTPRPHRITTSPLLTRTDRVGRTHAQAPTVQSQILRVRGAMPASTDERPLVELARAAPSTLSSSAAAPLPPPAAPGFSRLVRCNAPSSFPADGGGGQQSYPGNAISTTKYTPAIFVPKSLFEQFRRAANFFFLVVACVSFSPLAPYRAVSVLLPLVVVIGAAMAKEAVEDSRRKQQVRALSAFCSAPLFYSWRSGAGGC